MNEYSRAFAIMFVASFLAAMMLFALNYGVAR